MTKNNLKVCLFIEKSVENSKKMKISVQPEYISVACNRTPGIVDWNSDGIILYGATNAVVLYNYNQVGGNQLTVLNHHKSKVNSVKWLQNPDGTSTEFLSCSADKTAAIWTLVDGVYKITSCLEGHNEGVTSIGGLYLNDKDVVVYTASIDSTVRIWERRSGSSFLKQTISLNSGLCLTLHAHLLPLVNQPILLLALDDHKLHIYAATSVSGKASDFEEYHRLHILAGHEDWIRGLDVLNVDKDTILIASCSQDTYIRLWRIQHHTPDASAHPSAEIKVEQRLFAAYDEEWSVKLDAVLAGHEGWVYGVQWAPYHYDKETATKQPTYRLLSSSLDKTLIIWEPETSPEGSAGSGVWVEKVRVGEVGGNGLGFYGSRFGPKEEFLGHGYNGSFHIWRYNQESSLWTSSVVCGGHFGAVEDVRWEPRGGRYLMSVSADQTTRVHAPWTRDGAAAQWHEVARPQVHGYDMASLALTSATTFVSAAEEKVIRVFAAPHNFVHNFAAITGGELRGAENGGGPEGASVPSLGLSNKAVFVDDGGKADGDDNDGYFVPVTLTEPPTEETLMQNTLWPEMQKLYGHGYEVFCLDASTDGTLVASACKATSAEHASLLLWETTTWQQIQKLTSHQLTVTQIAFSPDSQQLLSVSRDRRWTLYRRTEGSNSFELAATTDKTNGVHSRIIWCCAWAHDSVLFATGSREGKVCVWSKTDTPSQTSLGQHALYGTPLELTTSVTALSFAPLVVADTRVVATGLDSGVVRLYSFAMERGWSLLVELDNSAAHHLTVKRLMFSPRDVDRSPGDRSDMLLASCGADHLVRIYTVSVST